MWPKAGGCLGPLSLEVFNTLEFRRLQKNRFLFESLSKLSGRNTSYCAEQQREAATWLIAHLSNTGVPVKLQGSLWVRALQLDAEPETCCFVVLAQSHGIFRGGGSRDGPVLQAGTRECVGNSRVRLQCVSHPQAVSPD